MKTKMDIPLIYVLALGGTISSKTPYHEMDEFYASPSEDIDSLVSSLPLEKENLKIKCNQIFQKISHQMTSEDLIFVAKKIKEQLQNEEVTGIVITQGTNCIEEVAYFISLVINTQKPILFTGAFRPRNALGYDGARNLYHSLLLAGNKELIGAGVLLSFQDSLISAREANKLNPSIMGDFSPNGAPMGFIQGKKLYLQRLPSHKHTYCSEFNIDEINQLAKVYIIYGHLDADAAFVEAAIANKVKGIISAGVGKGYQSKAVTQALICASEKGIVVVRCSRTGQGMVSKDPALDDQYGFIAGGSLSPQKARILLSVALTKTVDRREIQRFFDEY